MRVLNLDLAKKSHPIYIGKGLINQQQLFAKHINKQVMIVTNTVVAKYYLNNLKLLLSSYELSEVILIDGEQQKTLSSVNIIFDALLAARFERNCTLLALGGGVVGDICGFAAATYQRGVNFIQIPTTLLAQVDSSIGGKTGVNHRLGKNMIGAFYQPKCVIIDINTLKTLDNRQYSAGLAEIIKCTLLADIDFFRYLEKNINGLMAREYDLIIKTIYKSCQQKAKIVAQDEFEENKRALLNLGHTFGHAIENVLGYGVYLHGEAVAVGILMAAKLSMFSGYLQATDVGRIKNLLIKSCLPITINTKISATDFIKAMSLDKKKIDGNIRLILLKKLGEAFICDNYKSSLLNKVIDEFCQTKN